uniref:SCP domain-containing protein n=1 Tax=Caenorhabditis japonica TaxID=281687 RepID=A0A8R1HN48_CAEJA
MHKVLLLLLFILLHFRAPKNEIDAEFSSHCPYCRVAEGPSPCNGCDKNMTCFILSEYERFKKQAVKGVLTNTFEDRHFYPQNWRCDIKKMRKKYEFIRYSSDPTKQLMEDLFTIARRQGVPATELDYIKTELTKNRKTTHTTVFSPAREFYQKRVRALVSCGCGLAATNLPEIYMC